MDQTHAVNFIHQSRPSDSPFVEDIWQVSCFEEGDFVMCADVSWDIIVSTYSEQRQIYVDGPTSEARSLHYKPGMQLLGIRFKVGTTLSGLNLHETVDKTFPLAQINGSKFWLAGSAIEVPTQNTVDAFIEKLTRDRLIMDDHSIQAMLQEELMPVSRATQRRFLSSTGLSQMKIYQIQRAWGAMTLLQKGQPATQVAQELGYSDQAHMIKFLKRLLGQTPKNIEQVVHSQAPLSFSYNLLSPILV